MAQSRSAQRDTSTSASSPFSASNSYAPYDVFINHRGPDVKNNFAGHLHQELKSRGLHVFLDRPELQAGHSIFGQIKAAIEVASIHIAIFSQNYAESKWCLEELVLMLNSTATIIPVFYDVKPFELRWTDKGAYAEALRKHEEKQRYDLKTIADWKAALSHVADISGFELEACNRDEVELVDKVVHRVLKEVPKPLLHVAKYKIGLQEKIEDFERRILSHLEEEGRLEAKVVGIVGGGGIKKSTLAKEFFNRKRSKYNGSSFLFDVRENAAKKSINSLQSKLVKDLIGRDISIVSWEEGSGILEKNLKYCHALIILDDVDHVSQFDALILPIKHILDPKSLILVTSRDKHVFRCARMLNSSVYLLKGLNRPQSLELFCWHAFCQPHPLPGFEVLAHGFVEACDGLPLSLEVFGALLFEEYEKSYWEEQLNGLQKLPRDIQVRLKISYDSLDPEEQQIFLDIACFSIGENKDKWIRIWSGSGWKGSVGLRNLENKCLVEVDCENEIRMHHHLRDLGRNIAQEESMPRRLWSATIKDVYDLLEQSSSVTVVRGIKMAPRPTLTDSGEEGLFRSKSKMRLSKSLSREVFRISKLQLLEAGGDFVKSILSKVRSPNINLIWLCWNSCPYSSLPSWIPMHDLRVLEVYTGKLERLWQRESQAPLQLRELHIRHAPLVELPNSFGQLQHLEKVALYACSELYRLPRSFGNLTNLQVIELSNCQGLEMLPDSFGNLKNLQRVSICFCCLLKMLPPSLDKLTNLQRIDLSDCKSLQMLPNSIGNLTNLQMINLAGCESLEVLPVSFGTLTNLKIINLEDCISLKMLPNFMENFTNLLEINLLGCESLEVLPNSIENSTNLQLINLGGCSSLKVLPSTFGTLTNLKDINLAGCLSLEVLPNSIEKLTNLELINLAGCESLEVLPNGFGNLKNLKIINLEHCINLKMLSNFIENLTNLREINLAGCESLEVLPNSIGNLRNLQLINLAGWESLEVLPDAIGTLTSLKIINLENCICLKVLPNLMENLTNLHEINLVGCESLEVLPNSIENLTNLQSINLGGCSSLEVLPNAFGSLKNLKNINLEGCLNLEVLPNSMENLTNLQLINLAGCECLEVLPNAFGTLTNVNIINLEGCISLKMLPNFMENLTNRSIWRVVKVWRCFQIP